jgi:hypothetical protein
MRVKCYDYSRSWRARYDLMRLDDIVGGDAEAGKRDPGRRLAAERLRIAAPDMALP